MRASSAGVYNHTSSQFVCNHTSSQCVYKKNTGGYKTRYNSWYMRISYQTLRSDTPGHRIQLTLLCLQGSNMKWEEMWDSYMSDVSKYMFVTRILYIGDCTVWLTQWYFVLVCAGNLPRKQFSILSLIPDLSVHPQLHDGKTCTVPAKQKKLPLGQLDGSVCS